jgi:UDP-N-acetylmuramoyl-L-alanyl-D-glutamate--2,6-diaminopimelate ligase
MKLRMLIEDMEMIKVNGNTDIEVSGIAYDSRKIGRGDVFIAIKGENVDGHNFIEDAIKKGAVAIVYGQSAISNQQSAILMNKYPDIIWIGVNNTRDALAYISNNFCGRPSDKLTVIGVTGTNGKTTTTYLIKSILETWGKDVGLIGTISYLIKDKRYEALHTTPEALEFQSILKEMLSAKCSHVVTEVSSHALSQRRVDYTNFRAAVFTNLTRDHLDYHGTMEDYFKAKERLFGEILSRDGTAVINFDDVWGRRLIEVNKCGLLTYGIETGADIAAANITCSFDGLMFDIGYKDKTYNIKSHLVGMHNVYNILSAVGTALTLDIPWDAIVEGIKGMDYVRGRFEKVDVGQDFLCIVDYAHTEDALERLIYTARELTKQSAISNQQSAIRGRIITVFGCGGNRDRGKRPKMGTVATRLSDYVFITSDNPRNEDPMEIIREIEKGVSRRNYIIEPDRKKAIAKAVEAADTGDIVLVAGKGHEEYQEIKGVRHKFSDQETLKEAIQNKLKIQN